MARKQAKKLKLWAYEDDSFSTMVGGLSEPLTLSINPDSYKRAFRPLRAKDGTKLANGEVVDPTIVDPPPERFAMEIWFDGTGAIPGTGDVADEIEAFKQYALYYNGDIHSVNYVKLEWGGTKGLIFKGQLEDFSVDYTLFDNTGKPLRAKGTANFVQTLNTALRESMKMKNSPDMTHIRVVRAGDNLPLMCNRIYGDPTYYVQVARANQLEDIMTLVPGRRIYFPPLKK